MEKNLAVLYNELANKIIKMIPTEWYKVYFLGEIAKNKNSWNSIFYYKENEVDKKYIRQYEIRHKYNIPKNLYDKINWEIQEILLKVYDCFIDNGQEPWEQLSMSFDSLGKFNIDYDYKILSESEYTQIDREVIWAYNQFGYIPEEGTFFRKKLDNYLKSKIKNI